MRRAAEVIGWALAGAVITGLVFGAHYLSNLLARLPG